MPSLARLGAYAFAFLMCAAPSLAEDAKPAKPGIAKGSGVVVTLVGDREVKGVYLGRRDGAVWVGIDGGEIGLEPETIIKIAPSKTNDAEFLKRKAALAPKDAAGHWKLAEWAGTMGLEGSAKLAAKIVVSLDPEHREARLLLGHERVNGRWMEHDDAMRAQGLVEYRGEWIKQEQADQREMLRRIREDDARQRARQQVIIHTYGVPDRSRSSGYTESYVSPPKGTIR